MRSWFAFFRLPGRDPAESESVRALTSQLFPLRLALVWLSASASRAPSRLYCLTGQHVWWSLFLFVELLCSFPCLRLPPH